MIVGVEGRSGAGKSFWAVKRICESLAAGRRIVTNMENVYFRRMVSDLCRHDKKKRKEMLDRIVVIPTRKFLVEFPKVNIKNADVILDEVMLDFFSRDWAKMPKSTVFFLTQHRKYRCDFYYITQSIERVDSVLKSLTQYYIRLRNSSNWKLGPFKVPSVMVATWFQEDQKTIHQIEYTRPNTRLFGYYDTYALFENDAVPDEFGSRYSNVTEISYNGNFPITI